MKTQMKQKVTVAIIGDFQPERPSHKATNEALRHAADALPLALSTEWLPTPSLDTGTSQLEKYDAILCAPGGPYRSMAGALEAIRFARERGWPFLGT